MRKYTWILVFIILLVASAGGFFDPGFDKPDALYFPKSIYSTGTSGTHATTPGYSGLSYYFPAEPINLSSNSEKELLESCLEYIDSNSEIFAVSPANLVKLKATDRLGRWWVTFRQTHNDIPVLSGRVDFRVYGSGRLAFCGARIIESFDSETPIVNQFQASESARMAYKTQGDVDNTELVYWPDIRPESVIGRLAWQIDLRESPERHWRCYISAVDCRPLYRYNLVNFYDVRGNGKVMFLPLFYDDPMDTSVYLRGDMSLNYIRTGQSDNSGDYLISSYFDFTMPLKAYLSGAWVDVIDNEGEDGVYSVWVDPPAEHNFVFSPECADTDELNLFYHTNYIHEYYEKLDPPMSALDYPVPARAGIPGTANNAFWDGYGTNYGSGSDNYRNFALFANIIYHEYTHGITGWIYEGTYFPYADQPGAMNEAYSDYFAATNCNDPRIGYKCPVHGSMFRNMNNYYRMPDDWEGEVHTDGRIIGGAFWDLRERVRTSWADTLIHFTRYATPNTFDGFVPECLFTDDDDDDLSNGTPHYNEIFESFDLHGIGPGRFPKLEFMYLFVEIGDSNGYFEPGERLEVKPVVIADDDFAWPDIVGLSARISILSGWEISLLDSTSDFADTLSPGHFSPGDLFLLEIGPDALPHYVKTAITYVAENGGAEITDTLTVLVGRPQILLVNDSPNQSERVEAYYRETLDLLNVTYTLWRTGDTTVPDSYEEYPVMLWFTGDDTLGESISAADTAIIAQYMSTGGCVILTGQNMTSQFPYGFLENRFGAAHKATGGSAVAVGIGSGPISFESDNVILFGYPGLSNQNVALVTGISPCGGTPLYAFNTGDTCAVSYENGVNKTVLFGFGIEGMGGGPASLHIEELLARIFSWFELPVAGIHEAFVPRDITVIRAIPNPFNSTCRIEIGCIEPGISDLEIFSITGKFIRKIPLDVAGPYSSFHNPKPVVWDGCDYSGRPLPSGLYLIRAGTAGRSFDARVVLLR